MDIYEELLFRISNGERFKIDFKNRDLKIGTEMIIKGGEIANGYELTLNQKYDFGEPSQVIENLNKHFITYRDSKPTKNDVVSYFKCKKACDLSDTELMLVQNRELCRAELEWFVLNLILTGWSFDDLDNNPKHWYLKTKYDCVLLRDWF